MSTDPLVVTRPADAGMVVSINDDPFNRVTLATVERLEEVLEDVAADDSVRAMVLTAEGTSNPSVGMNLKELRPGMGAAGSPDAFLDRRPALVSRLERPGKP